MPIPINYTLPPALPILLATLLPLIIFNMNLCLNNKKRLETEREINRVRGIGLMDLDYEAYICVNTDLIKQNS